jgi:hypothetical protein
MMHSQQNIKFLNCCMCIVLDQFLGNNLIGMHGTSSIVKFKLFSFLHGDEG